MSQPNLSPPTGDLIAFNPASGQELGRFIATPTTEVGAIVAQAARAQERWGALPWKARRQVLQRFWSILARDAESWAEAIRDEVGKPTIEGMAEVVSTLDALRWTVRHARRTLASRALGRAWQRALLIPPARLHWAPQGVIGIIGTWNYPLLLNAPTIAQALAAGNAVVWKPSDFARFSGKKLQDALWEAGFPEQLVALLQGGPEVAQALIHAGIQKAVFTGGIEAGRAVLGELGRLGIPAIAELSGFDAALVLPDAPVASTVRALAWGAFVGAGQTCVAVKRVYVVGDGLVWAQALADQARSLRVGDPSGPVDVGPMISKGAVERFHATIQAAEAAGARVLAGGRPVDGLGSYYLPTVLLAEGPEPEQVLAGCFGPVVLVRGVPDVETAIRLANASPYGLSASVWSRDVRQARSVALRLEAGMVAVNEAVTPSAHAAIPFGGCKASGYGRTRGPLGLLEMVQPRVIHVRKPGGFRPHLFPYGGLMPTIFEFYRRAFHPRGLRK